jgi:hypothetical protein
MPEVSVIHSAFDSPDSQACVEEDNNGVSQYAGANGKRNRIIRAEKHEGSANKRNKKCFRAEANQAEMKAAPSQTI